MNPDQSKNFGHQEMSNGPSFNWRTPWTLDPTPDDYAMADAREEAWIRGQIAARNLPFTYENLRSFVSRNIHLLSGGDGSLAIELAKDPKQTMYRLFWVAERIVEAMQEGEQ